MKSKIYLLLLLLALTLTTTEVFSQKTNEKERMARLSIEIDPATFMFNGYSAHFRIKPASSDNLLYGVGFYAMDMPSQLVNMNNENADNGWEVRINQGTGLFGEYHFSEVNRKLFIGTQISTQQFKIRLDNYPDNEKFTNLLFMGYGGYTIQPFSLPLYFKLWGGIGYTSKISGKNFIMGRNYDIAPITIFATLHLGYSF